MKEEPYTYDMTFCVSKCEEKCDRHIDNYKFEVGRFVSLADFKCEEKQNEIQCRRFERGR